MGGFRLLKATTNPSFIMIVKEYPSRSASILIPVNPFPKLISVVTVLLLEMANDSSFHLAVIFFVLSRLIAFVEHSLTALMNHFFVLSSLGNSPSIFKETPIEDNSSSRYANSSVSLLFLETSSSKAFLFNQISPQIYPLTSQKPSQADIEYAS